ncbi:P-loop NTPase family protein [Caballeronia glebae]|uniref:ATP-binding protein n=1 Tax=Caballeronia glebae TaxID=1777143 RepID=A0A158DF66_9BURK|nr:ATPase [Caballeronia glebae]SAK93231.1 ATP-binding protein [Caballeronia glebae]
MIDLFNVSDSPKLFGSTTPLLLNADLSIPKGRYALLSRTPELHRSLIDVLTGLRPPTEGFVRHSGLVSWPLGRQAFIRGKVNGRRMVDFVSSLYGVDAKLSFELVADLLTKPDHLSRPIEHWPLFTRQEFSLALGLTPAFDVYVIEGAIPFEPCRFTRLWLALFEKRLIGRTLILSTSRQKQMAEYCTKGLVYERSSFRIDDGLDECIRRFPARRSRSESGDGGEAFDLLAGTAGTFGV